MTLPKKSPEFFPAHSCRISVVWCVLPGTAGNHLFPVLFGAVLQEKRKRWGGGHRGLAREMGHLLLFLESFVPGLERLVLVTAWLQEQQRANPLHQWAVTTGLESLKKLRVN